jgi:hypothetical protein
MYVCIYVCMYLCEKKNLTLKVIIFHKTLYMITSKYFLEDVTIGIKALAWVQELS